MTGGIQLDEDTRFEGVSGWLAFFCVIHVFVRPIFLLIRLTVGYQNWYSIWNRGTLHGSTNFVLGAIFDIVWSCIGVTIGYAIYTLRPQSIRWAKTYLLVGVALSVVALLSGRRSGLGGIGNIVWYSYLEYSDQVRRLFPKTQGRQLL